jgi:hypothetical protein
MAAKQCLERGFAVAINEVAQQFAVRPLDSASGKSGPAELPQNASQFVGHCGFFNFVPAALCLLFRFDRQFHP